MSEVEGNTLAWPGQDSTTPTVPASVRSGGVDTAGLLKEIQGDTATQQKLMQAAITPVSGQHVGQVPSALTKTTPDATMQQGYAEPKNKGQAMANMITAAGNLIGKFVHAERQQKQEHITNAATKLFTAQAAIDEAQQQHDSATAIGDTATAQKAQELITKNTAVRDGITSDPKLRKALAKGLNINYIDPSENKTEEHAAVQAAIKNVKTLQEKRELVKAEQQKRNQQGAQNFGAAFANSQPQTLAPNTMAQQQYASYMEAQKANAAATRALIPLLSAQVRAASTASLEDKREAHADAVNLFKSQDAWERLGAQIGARNDLAATEFGYRMREIAARGSQELATFKQKLAAKEADPATQLKAYNTFQASSAETTAKLAKAVTDLQVLQDSYSRQKNPDPGKLATIGQQLELARQAQTTYGEAATQIQKQYNKLAGTTGEGGSSESRSGTSTRSLSSASTYLSDDAADPDENEDF